MSEGTASRCTSRLASVIRREPSHRHCWVCSALQSFQASKGYFTYTFCKLNGTYYIIIEDLQICGSFMSDIGCCPQRSQFHNFEGNVGRPIGCLCLPNFVLWIFKIKAARGLTNYTFEFTYHLYYCTVQLDVSVILLYR